MNVRKVGVWVRVSTERQVETESHIHHEIRAKEFVKSRGWEIAKTYMFEGMSGKSVMEYSETKKMLEDVRNKRISALVFSKVSRLARNTIELIEISKIFQEYGADLISMDMQIDTSTATGRHFFRQIGSQAEWEREMIVERIKDSIKVRAKLGKHLGGQPPLGYMYVDKKLTINKEESLLCNQLFELFLEHKRKRTVARLLNEKGFRTRKGNKFTDATVRRMLLDPVYKGLQRVNYSTMINNKRVIKPKEEWIFHKVTPTVCKELWDNVQKIIKQQSKPRSQPLNRKVHLFTKYVFCQCGAKMYTHNRTENYLCRSHCGNLIHKEDLEEVFKTELHKYAISQSQADDYSNTLQNITIEKKQEYKTFEKEKAKLAVKIEKLLDLHIKGQIETEAFKKYHKEPYERLNQVEQSLLDLESEISMLTHQETSTNDFFEKTKTLYEKWDDLNKDEKRNVIETITNKIVVGKQDIAITLYKMAPDGYISSSLENGTNGQRNQLLY